MEKGEISNYSHRVLGVDWHPRLRLRSIIMSTSNICTYLIGKCNKAKSTAPLCITIHHDNGINDFAKFLKELEELFVIDCYSQLIVHMMCSFK